MEVKNGLIIDGVLYEATSDLSGSCSQCPLRYDCDSDEYSRWEFCTFFNCKSFINRGKVKIEKEETI